MLQTYYIIIIILNHVINVYYIHTNYIDSVRSLETFSCYIIIDHFFPNGGSL